MFTDLMIGIQGYPKRIACLPTGKANGIIGIIIIVNIFREINSVSKRESVEFVVIGNTQVD